MADVRVLDPEQGRPETPQTAEVICKILIGCKVRSWLTFSNASGWPGSRELGRFKSASRYLRQSP